MDSAGQPLVGCCIRTHTPARQLFFLGELPSLIARDRPLAAQLGSVHSFLGYALLTVIGLHAAAALLHHFIRRDNVLKRDAAGAAAALIPFAYRRATRHIPRQQHAGGSRWRP